MVLLRGRDLWHGAPASGKRLVRQSVLLVVIEGGPRALGAGLAGQPRRPHLTGDNPWQCRGLSLGAALVDRHRHDGHVVALLALLPGVAVDVGQDRLDDVVDVAPRGADPAR